MDDHSGCVMLCTDVGVAMMMMSSSSSSTSLHNIAKQHLQIWVPVLSRYWQVPLSNIVIYPSVAVYCTTGISHYRSGAAQNGYPDLEVA